jgi:hypothetical protein
VRLVRLRRESADIRIGGEHLIVYLAVDFDVSTGADLTVVVQISSGRVNEGVVVRARPETAISTEVICIAFALVVRTAKTVSGASTGCKS